jgi:hypothetical protein
METQEDAQQGVTGRAVLPRNTRYNLSTEEQDVYAQFVGMLSHLERDARLQLAESAIHTASKTKASQTQSAAHLQWSGMGEATLAYAQHNEVGGDVALRDGFFDCGRGWGGTLADIGAAPLLRLMSASNGAASNAERPTQGREVVVVDATRDARLKRFTQRTVRELQQLARRGGSTMQLTALLACRVAGRLGGYGPAAAARVACGSAGDIQRVRRECHKGDVVPIGALRLGVCRHRAVLFKYCADCFSEAVTRNGGGADAQPLRCRLLRGRLEGQQQQSQLWSSSALRGVDEPLADGRGGVLALSHAWNLVWCPARGSWLLIDVMHDPTVALAPGSTEALRYHHTHARGGPAADATPTTKKSGGACRGRSLSEPASIAPTMPGRRSGSSRGGRPQPSAAMADRRWLCRKHQAAPQITSVTGTSPGLFCQACFKIRASMPR